MSTFVMGAGIGPVTLISRSADKLDAFAVGLDGRVYTAAWEPGDTAWRGWWLIDGVEAAPCAPVSAVSRSADKLDIFVVGIDGRVYTAAWEPGDTTWRGWWQVGSFKTVLHAPISAVSRSADKLDIFAVGPDGRVHTAAWEPGNATWQGWWVVEGTQAPPGAPVSAVVRSPDKLDIFVVDQDGRVCTAAWEPGNATWQGWWVVEELTTAPRTPVSAVSRSADKLDIFAVGPDGRVYTAAWEPGSTAWRGWWVIEGITTLPKASVGAVSRSTDKLDISVAGSDGRVYTAAWEPGNAAWQGWWTISDLTVGMTDPRINEWRKVGKAFQEEGNSHSEEAQGITTDGEFWYLSSNGSKTIRKYDAGKQVIGQISVQPGNHIGAPGYYEGWIYVPIQKPFGVWKTTTDFSTSAFIAADGGEDRFPWCDVNPLNGRLYTCEYDKECVLHQQNRRVLYAYDRETLARRPEDDILLGPTPIPCCRIQGAVFSPRGRVILVTYNPNGIFCFSTLTGHCFGGLPLGDFGSSGSEAEGVTIRPWQFNGTLATVHVLELDNDWINKDDCYLHSYSVPDPAHL